MRFAIRLLVSLTIFSSMALAGGVGPWPFGKEIKFPWKTIPGTWLVEDGTGNNLFNFKINTNSNGEKEIEIILLKSDYCETVAQGKGVLNGKFITAQMLSSGRAFNLTIHAFNSSDVSGENLEQKNKRALRSGLTSDKVVMALTIFPIGNPDQRSAFEITKVAPAGAPACW